MDGFVVHELAADVTVRVTRSMPALPPSVDTAVERLWRAALARVETGGAGRMFNGRVFSADQITPHAITGHITEYRRVVAQLEDPSLFAQLGLRSLAVCGVLCCADGVVFGRRPDAAIYQPGLWQLPPAGSVDSGALRPDGTMNLAAQLLIELAEEVGISPAQVGAPMPLCVVEHPDSHVSDVGMVLSTTLNAQAIHAAHRAIGDGEYRELRIIPPHAVADFVAGIGDRLVPPAREFLFRAGLLNQGLSPPTGP